MAEDFVTQQRPREHLLRLSAPRRLIAPLVSRHERYSLVRRHIGTPSVLTYIATFDEGADSVPSLEDLRSRISFLCQQHPILCSRVEKVDTNKPILKTVPFDEKTIYSRVLEQTVRKDQGASLSQMIVRESLQWGAAFAPETGDLWRVGRIREETNSEVAIVLCVDHILGDGRGSLSLLMKLLHKHAVPIESPARLPAALEDRVSIKPALTTLLTAIFQSLLLPKLPNWVVPSFLRPQPYWPFDLQATAHESSSRMKNALEAEVGISVGEWKASQVRQVRSAVCQSLPTASLNAILSASAMVALWIVEARTSHGTTGRSTRIKLTSPTSERSPALGHSDVLGNYVGTVDTEMSLSAASDFLNIVRTYSAEMRSQINSKLPPTAWGMLDYIDDPDTSSIKDGLNGWTKFFIEKATAREPYSGSLEVSNLGLAPLLNDTVQKQMKRLDWMQTPTAIGSAIAVNVVGCRSHATIDKYGDISFSVTWRKNSVAHDRLSELWVDQFLRVFERLPEVIARGLELKGSMSLADLQLATSAIA